MNKIYNLIIVIVVLIVGMFALKHSLVSTQVNAGADTIYIYNWGDYIDPTLITKFEEESGYKVVYEVFDSNESMYTKVKTQAAPYDIVIPSEYMIGKMVKEDLLIELDHSKITGLSNIDPNFLDPVTDPGNKYSVPYFWGTVGVVYNTQMTDLTFDSWQDLWDESLENDLILVDGAREVMGLSLNSLGYSLNSTDQQELKLAQQKLFLLQENVRAIVGDEVLQLMPQEEAAAAVTWSGSAADMMSENENLTYAIPSEGTNIWLDSFVIPKTSKNQDGAYEFINFMLEPQNAAINAEYIGYSTPNKEALQYMDPEIVNDPRFYPSDEVIENLEYYETLSDEYLGIYNDLFLEFKMY